MILVYYGADFLTWTRLSVVGFTPSPHSKHFAEAVIMITRDLTVTNRISKGDQAIASICLSVCPSVSPSLCFHSIFGTD